MNNRFAIRPLGTNSINENAMLSLKSAALEPTPRKLPFKDSTNKELTKSALKPAKNVTEKAQAKSEQTSSVKAKEAETASSQDDVYDDAPFVFPPDKNCFCCGSDRKTDGEIWGEKLALSDEFWDQLLSADVRLPERFVEVLSPTKLPPLVMAAQPADELPLKHIEMPSLDDSTSMDESMDEQAAFKSALDISQDLDSSLEVPKFDLDFSIGADTSNNFDGSIIQDW